MATRKTTSTAKPTATKATAAATAKAPEPVVVSTAAAPEVTAPDMKKKELVDLVVARAGVKKRDAKPAVEAALAILGEAIAEGRELNLPPLGKLRINRAEDKANGRVTICKLRQNKAPQSGKEPLAEPAE